MYAWEKSKNPHRRKQRSLSPLDTISWSLLSCTVWFVSDLVGNPNCWFLLKIFTLYNLEKICILHGHVFVMVIISHTVTKTCPCNIQRIFFCCKNENSQCTNFDIFLIFAQNIDCGYTLGPPRRGGSNEYLKSLFRSTKFHIMITFLI